jgi:hypothetical protein
VTVTAGTKRGQGTTTGHGNEGGHHFWSDPTLSSPPYSPPHPWHRTTLKGKSTSWDATSRFELHHDRHNPPAPATSHHRHTPGHTLGNSDQSKWPILIGRPSCASAWLSSTTTPPSCLPGAKKRHVETPLADTYPASKQASRRRHNHAKQGCRDQTKADVR